MMNSTDLEGSCYGLIAVLSRYLRGGGGINKKTKQNSIAGVTTER
jgi:hypothetical protein